MINKLQHKGFDYKKFSGVEAVITDLFGDRSFDSPNMTDFERAVLALLVAVRAQYGVSNEFSDQDMAGTPDYWLSVYQKELGYWNERVIAEHCGEVVR